MPDRSKELISQWKQLNEKASSLLGKHKSFREYNSVRLQMDKIELLLRGGYDIDVQNL
jgi:hypothetical protein